LPADAPLPGHIDQRLERNGRAPLWAAAIGSGSRVGQRQQLRFARRAVEAQMPTLRPLFILTIRVSHCCARRLSAVRTGPSDKACVIDPTELLANSSRFVLN